MSSNPLIFPSLSPPSSREEAISQAKLCLSSSLPNPLKSPLHHPKLKLKKHHHQPLLRIEIPIADDASTPSLAHDLFASLPVTKQASKSNLLVLWPSSSLLDPARRAFSSSDSTSHSDVSSASDELVNTADWAVFVAPEASALEDVRDVTRRLSPKPAVLFNPKWGFEEEKGFGGELGRFVGSFEVVYCFMGLEVRGLLSRRKGVVFKLGREEWLVMVEDEGEKKGGLMVVSRFKKRPEIGEVENVLYNLMAVNSPVAKSVRFFRGLASSLWEKRKE